MYMKKPILILLIMWLSAVPSFLSAQTKDATPAGQHLTLSGGPVLESNLSGFLHSGVAGGDARMQAGVSAGGFLDLGIGRSFSVQGQLLVQHKRSDFEWGGQTGQFRYWGVEIPIYALYHFRLRGGQRLSFGLGPYTEFGFDAKWERGGLKGDLYEKDTATGLPILRDSNTGFAVRIGYEWPCGLGLNATYKASVTNLLDANSSTVRMHPHALSVGLSWRFSRR